VNFATDPGMDKAHVYKTEEKFHRFYFHLQRDFAFFLFSI